MVDFKQSWNPFKEEWNWNVKKKKKKSAVLTEKSNFDVFTSRLLRAKERITEFKGSSIGDSWWSSG